MVLLSSISNTFTPDNGRLSLILLPLALALIYSSSVLNGSITNRFERLCDGNANVSRRLCHGDFTAAKNAG
jgi:hypothetical protein